MIGHRRKWAWGLALFVVSELTLYALWPLIDDNDPFPSAEQQLAVAAALLLLGLPHVIAYLGRKGRPWLFKVAGGLGMALTGISVMGHSLILITIPLLLIPSIFYLARRASPQPAGRVLGMFPAVLLLAVGAGGSFFLTEDPRCSISVRRGNETVHEREAPCDETNSGVLGGRVVGASSTSDTIAWHESLLSLAFSSGAIFLCIRVPRHATEPRRSSAVVLR